MNRPPPLALRLFAALCTVLVLLLGVVAVDDGLHARLHANAAPVADCGHAHPDSDSGNDHATACAVDLFAAGVSLPVDPSHVIVDPIARQSRRWVTTAEAFVASAPHALPPGRGPPQG